MPAHALLHLLLLACSVSLLPPRSAAAQSMDPERAAAVKAGVVVNFLRYTTWPEEAFEKADSPIVLTLVGESQIDAALAEAVEGLTIEGRRVELKRVAYPLPAEGETQPDAAALAAFHEALRASHADFFGESEAGRIDGLLEAVDGADVLTISEIDTFAEKGGMFRLTVRQRRIAFDANEKAIKETKLQVSSQVLKLARIVVPADEEQEEEG